MATGKKTGGRKKGTPNKVTQDVRQAILSAAEELGGSTRLLEWVKEDPMNERLFWSSIWIKVLPKEVNANVTGNVIVQASELDERI